MANLITTSFAGSSGAWIKGVGRGGATSTPTWLKNGRKAAALLAAVAVVLALTACGGGGGGSSVAVPQTTPVLTTPVASIPSVPVCVLPAQLTQANTCISPPVGVNSEWNTTNGVFVQYSASDPKPLITIRTDLSLIKGTTTFVEIGDPSWLAAAASGTIKFVASDAKVPLYIDGVKSTTDLSLYRVMAAYYVGKQIVSGSEITTYHVNMVYRDRVGTPNPSKSALSYGGYEPILNLYSHPNGVVARFKVEGCNLLSFNYQVEQFRYLSTHCPV